MDMATDDILEPLERVAKLVADVSGLLGALRDAIPPKQSWQRQILRDLEEADRHLQVLRLTIAMDREDVEIRDAASELHATLARSTATLVRGRADEATRAAMRLMTALAKEVHGGLSSLIGSM